jgi:hypothetical protein
LAHNGTGEARTEMPEAEAEVVSLTITPGRLTPDVVRRGGLVPMVDAPDGRRLFWGAGPYGPLLWEDAEHPRPLTLGARMVKETQVHAPA